MAESIAAPAPSTSTADKLRSRMRNPWLMRFYMLRKLPLALIAGVRVRELDRERCVVTIPYGWRSTNPFRSTYFAALSMAAEMSTGALSMAVVQSAPAPVAMLIVGMEASFEKKATALTTFTCEDGAKVIAAVAETVRTGEPATARLESVGRMPDGLEVARFAFTWSFKKRSKG
jgi:Domain of unknown function (DUF4442)